MEKCLKWPQMGPGVFVPTNPDLANILGRTGLDCEIFMILIFWDPKIWQAGPGLGRAWAWLGPGLGPSVGL